MNATAFSKYEALGNDFVIIDESELEGQREPRTTLKQRQTLCDRKRGVGADGVITLLAPLKDESSIFMHVTNADGSIPENCGNGLRCVARWMLDQGRIQRGQRFFIDTLSGAKEAVIVAEDPEVELGFAEVDLQFSGEALLSAAEHFAKVHHIPAPSPLAFVTIGNPHFIFETTKVEEARLEMGPEVATLSLFKHGANISFVCQDGPDVVSLRVWERGAGATDACGSGAGATVAALMKAGKINRASEVRVKFGKGEVFVRCSVAGDQFKMILRGPAEKCFSGVKDLE